jgi:hypothetical protein
MSKFTIGIAVFVFASTFSAATYAAPPEKGAPQRAAPQRAAPQRAAPQRAAAPRAAPQRAAVQRAAPQRAAAQRSAPQRAAVQRAAPQGVAPRIAAQRNTGARAAVPRNAPTNPAGNRALTNRNATRNTTRAATFNTRLNSTVKANAVRETLNSRTVAGALSNRSALRNPNTRARITASAATAGWHNGLDGGRGWWRHSNGGYGWVGPLYWPFAYDDMYDYAMWGDDDDDSFWGYGYGDIYVGLFAPYAYDDLNGYLPESTTAYASVPGQATPTSATPSAATSQLTQMCGEDSHDIAGLPIDQIQTAIQPTGAQQTALDDLANASLKAAQDIKAACPADIALTAPSRLAAMQQRIEAMIAAVTTVQPPLEKFYGLLSDEQKARLTALGNDQRQNQPAEKPAGSLAKSCGTAQPGVTEWPTAEIDSAIRPTEAQRASLTALQNASATAADMLKAACLTDNPLTPPARLAAVGKRLDTMLQAVKTVRSALNSFYGSLSDEQKARFEAIGPQRTSQLESLDVVHTTVRRPGINPVGQIIRRLMSFTR